MSNGRYILNENGDAVPEPDLIKWGKWYARLIAAAPDLLRVLKTTLHRLERIDGFGCPQSLIDEMREAIAKAEGGA